MAEISDDNSEISSNESGEKTSSSSEISQNSETHSPETSYVDDNDDQVDAVISKYEDVTQNPIQDVPDNKMKELIGDLETEDGIKTQGFVTDKDITNSKMSELEKSLKNADKTGNPSTPQEVSAKQEESLKDGLNRLENGDNLTRMEKGNLGEIMADQHYISQGYTALISPESRVVSLDEKGHHGIDGVYEKDGQYVIVEVKYGSGKLIETTDGRQMSWDWISARLENAVGPDKAMEITKAYHQDIDKHTNNVRFEVYHYNPKSDEDGLTHSDIYGVNEHGYKSGPSIIVDSYRGAKCEESHDAYTYGRKT